MTDIVVLDYGIGNISSICRALSKNGSKVVLSSDESEILSADGIVLPGVGAFAHGMERLTSAGLGEVIKRCAGLDKPILGICLGMQMLFDGSSEFGDTEGLGLIPGFVKKLKISDKQNGKLPHVSWNEIMYGDASGWGETILDGVNNEEDMYFVHSYCASPTNSEHVLSKTTYSGHEFCSTVKSGNIYGCQYHPEKSGPAGLQIINNFTKISGEERWRKG